MAEVPLSTFSFARSWWGTVRPSVPTILSVARLFAPVYLVPLYLTGYAWIFALLAILAAGTDWLDGYLARKLHCESELGAKTDIYADKIFCVTLIAIGISVTEFSVHFAAIGILVVYHIVVTGMRFIGVTRYEPNRVAKLKMFIEMSALLVAFGVPASLELTWLNTIGFLGIWVAAGLAIWSMLRYLGLIHDWPLWLWPRKV